MFTDLDLFEENYFSLVYLTMFTSTLITNISVSEDYKSDFPLKQYLLLMLIDLTSNKNKPPLCYKFITFKVLLQFTFSILILTSPFFH